MNDALQEVPAAGWYPDPLKADRERWWDGEAWTDYVQRPPEAEQAPAPEEPSFAGEQNTPAPLTGVHVEPEPLGQAEPVPGLVMPDPALAELQMPKLSLPDQPPGSFLTPPADPGYGALVPAAPTGIASFRLSGGSVGGRGSSLQAVRAIRPPASAVKRSNPAATVSFLFGVLSLILPVIFIALVAVFTGLSGMNRADESYPPVGRGKAVAGVALGLVSLILTAIAVMVAMADPEIRAFVLSYL